MLEKESEMIVKVISIHKRGKIIKLVLEEVNKPKEKNGQEGKIKWQQEVEKKVG